MFQLLLPHNKLPQIYQCKITVWDAHKFCWSGILPRLGGQFFARHSITEVTQWYLAGGLSGLEDLRWLLPSLVPWHRWDCWLQCLHVASPARPSQGSWTSYMVAVFPQGECPERTRQKLLSFGDLLSEFLWCYFCYTLLVKAVMNLLRFNGERKRYHLLMGPWHSNLGEHVGREIFFWK